MPTPITTYYENGQEAIEEYVVGDKYHRENGPACITWHSNGQKAHESYSINGNLHKEDGPAYIEWYKNGRIIWEIYFIDGHQKSIGYFLEQGFKENKCKNCNKTYLEK